MDFENKYNVFFYYDGHYLYVDISESKMKDFVEKNKITLDKLTSEFKREINSLKK